MTPRRLFVLALLSVTLAARAEEPPPLALFALPKVELKSAVSIRHAGSAAPAETSIGSQNAADAVPVPATEGFSLTRESPTLISEAGLQSFESMNDLPVLRAIERPIELGGAAGWLNDNVWDPVFAPEVIKVGKVKMTGGLIAAVKRKNPFCLLHPLVFAASW